VHPIPSLEPDWYTTYHGGQGFISESSGIDRAIAKGGSFMAKLREKPVDPKVEVAVLAGDQADMTTVLNENSGPSDGVVFVASANSNGNDRVRAGA
jgi:hypothetical protein